MLELRHPESLFKQMLHYQAARSPTAASDFHKREQIASAAPRRKARTRVYPGRHSSCCPSHPTHKTEQSYIMSHSLPSPSLMEWEFLISHTSD